MSPTSSPPPPPAPESPRNIALVLLRYFPHGGLQRIAEELAKALAQRGHSVRLYVQEWRGDQPDQVEIVALPNRRVSNHSSAQRFGVELLARLRLEPADVVLGFDRLPGLDLYFCADPCYSARLRRDRSAIHRWTPRARTFLRLEREVFGTASSTRILLMNPSERAVIQAEYGTAAERFTALPPGYSATRRRGPGADEQRSTLRHRWGLDGPGSPALVLLALGSDFHRKGFDRALRALHHLRNSSGTRVVLAIAGSEDPARLQRLAGELALHRDVLMLGPRDDVAALLQAADILVHPCRSEPAGMVLLEALSAGLPVITTACAGYAPHVAASGAGVVLDEQFHLPDLCRAIQDLRDAPRDQLTSRALDYMSSLDPRAMIDTAIREIERSPQRSPAPRERKEHWAEDDPLHAAVGRSDPFEWLAAQRGETLREKAGRRTFRFSFEGTSYFAKLSRGVGLREALKELCSLRTPPLDSEREARALERLDRSNVPAPKLVGWGRRGWLPLQRRSFVVTRDVGTQRTLEDVANALAPGAFLERRRWIERVARLTAAMHAAGVNHRDLYFGHILVEGDVEAPKLVLIDLHRAQVWKKIPERWLAKDLGALGFAASDHGLTRTDRARFVKHYGGATFASTFRSRRRLWERAARRARRVEAERQRKGADFGG